MPLYLCRWPNGDCSFVLAANKGAAIELLDEVDNAEGCPLIPLRDFMVHFRLTDGGDFEAEGFGEITEDVIYETAYPLLNKAILSAPSDEKTGGLTDEGKLLIQEAVARERERVRPKKFKEPETELGKIIKSKTAAPTRVVNRIIRQGAKERLKKFKGEGKPN